MVQGDRAVIAQAEVNHKTNEITGFKPLLEDLDLSGAVVTADAMHAQREHARFLVEEKSADYLFGVKGNQPKLLEAIEAVPQGSFPPEHEETVRGHGRIVRRFTRVAPAPEGLDFPHAAQVVVVQREVADLADRMT